MSLEFLNPKHCALMVVDIQDRLMRVISGQDAVLRNSVLLLKTAKTLDLPIVATTQYVARIGELLPEIMAELGEAVSPMDKLEFGCFNNPTIARAVSELPREIDTLIVCGVETHICVYQTVLGALRLGYKVWVPEDAVSSRAEGNWRSGLARLREIGAVVANTELVIYELLRQAGTPEFKALLPFLK